ncbi:MAG: S8 family serine peptidase [Actinobacteria bacterium]|nr:S8 family serine peptidase [Actinomycetota bacterium]
MHSISLERGGSRYWYALMATVISVLLMAQFAPGAGAFAQAVFSEAVDKALILDAERSPASKVSVIVGKRDPSSSSLESAVRKTGGTVKEQLPIVNGFSATIPARAITTLAADPNLRSLTKNRAGKFEMLSYDETNVNSSSPKSTGASKLWAETDYGSGIGIAVIDTGISPMNDFTKLNGHRIVHGPDLSGEGNLLDTYGHGTVMAGLIAGDGYDSQSNSSGAHVGLAPKSHLISIKVAGANGVADVSTILAAMHWVAAYRDQFNIRVMNLSWGTKGTQSYKHDPLNYAVQRLWQLGIVPVVAAGNSGSKAGTITKPADDPFVLTVGAYNDKQNLDMADDMIPSWSSRGPTLADNLTKPDIVAPGRYITSTRSYGSTIEKEYPKALFSPSYIRGSGTSQAAAVTSGAVALLLKKKPHLAPAQVKYAIMSVGSQINAYTANDQGAGRLHIDKAAALADPIPYANSTTEPSNGLGSLEASRGGLHVQTDCNGDGVAEVIEGEMTVQCEAWDGTSWTGTSWTGTSWTGTSWTGASFNGTSWTGTSWTGTSWTGGSWTGTSWTGTSWTGGSWTGTSWTNSDFAGANWNGTSWTGTSWTGTSWTGTSWTGGSWTGTSWTGTSWTGTSWTGTSWTGTSWTTGEYNEFTTAEYDEDLTEFQTAFWGDRPQAGDYLPGEVSEQTETYRSRR